MQEREKVEPRNKLIKKNNTKVFKDEKRQKFVKLIRENKTSLTMG